jgi:drug/metabolite transporter (DMT)-like permease
MWHGRSLPLPVVVAYVVCALVWGTTWFAIRVSIGPDGYPTYESVALRFAIASVVLLAICAIGRLRPLPSTRRQWIWLVVAGVLDAAGYLLVYLGEEDVPGGLAAVLFGVQPLILAILLFVTRMEPVRPGAILGAIVSIAGVALIGFDRSQASHAQLVGVFLVIGSVLCSTLYSMVMKRHAEGVHPVVATTIFLTVTAISLGLVVLVRGPAPLAVPALKPTLALLYLAIFGSVIAFATYFWLLARLSLVAVSTLVFVFPLVSLAADALWEHQVRLGARAYVGVAITLAGLAVNLMMERARLRRSAGS